VASRQVYVLVIMMEEEVARVGDATRVYILVPG
jgi:hypothetical protein